MSDEKITDIQRANLAHFMENGPGLSYAYKTYIVARDPSAKQVMLGGLGGTGMGQMWVSENDRHKDYPGYVEARILPAGSVVID